jgi:dihydrofolate synthase/folylpolyglutamate synthase
MNLVQCRSYLQDLQRFGIKLGLENVTNVLASFDHPQRSFPSVHVAGTNGKGSVCAMLAEILSLHGLRVGLYTSPHLVRVEERIRAGGEEISTRDFCRLTAVVKGRIDRLLARKKLEAHPTFFEVLTILALLYFREKKVDIAVLEVGMGGRFDATNVVTPVVSVITNISKDHQEYLGKKIGQIAFEKAGIIKPGVPVVCGAESKTALGVIRRDAGEKEAPLFLALDRENRLTGEKKKSCYIFEYSFGDEMFRFSPGLLGAHQGRNAAIAIAAASVLNWVWKPLEKKKIIRGIGQARWEGRLESVSRNPLILLDGAHNEAGAAALARYITDFCPEPPVIVLAIMKDKAIKRVSRILFPLAKKVILTSIPYPRAAPAEEVSRLARPFRDKIILEASLKKAVDIARAEAGRRGTVLITGSLFLVGEAKKMGIGVGRSKTR